MNRNWSKYKLVTFDTQLKTALGRKTHITIRSNVDFLQVARSDYWGRKRDRRAWVKMAAGSISTSRATHENIPRASFAMTWKLISALHLHIYRARFFSHRLNSSFVPQKKRATRGKSRSKPFNIARNVGPSEFLTIERFITLLRLLNSASRLHSL